MNAIPSINIDSEALDSDALSKHLDMLGNEVALRTRLMCADNYGIVSNTDPAVYQSTSVNPLWVVISDQYTCSVASGSAVTKSGLVISLDTSDISLTAVSEGAYNIIYAQAELVEDDDFVLSSNGEQVSTGTHVTSVLKCSDLAAYLSLSTTVRESTVVLALVQFSTSGNTLVQEMSGVVIRPWFSSVDREHRSKIGSGDVTSTNVHGLGLNDLSVGGVKLYEQLTTTGMILSKDSSVSGTPGYLCSDAYSSSSIKTDATGEVTKRSFFTGVGVYYLELNTYPNVICAVLGDAVNGNRFEYAVDHIPGTKILVFYASTKPGNVTVYYVRSPSLGITSETASSVTFSQVDNRELVVASGEALSAVKNTTAHIRRYSGIPVNLRMMVDATGSVVLDPKVVLASKHPTEIVGSIQEIKQTFQTPCFVGIGATKLGYSIDMYFAVRIVGTSTTGTALSEVVEFDSLRWSDNFDVIGTTETQNQIRYTKQVFSSVTSVEILNDALYPIRSCDPSGYLVVYAKLDPSKHRNALVATGFWNGRSLKRLEDARRILPVVRDGVYGVTPITSIGELISGVNEIFTSGNTASKRIQTIISEDFQQPRYLNAPSVVWQGREVLDVDPLPTTVVDSSLYENVYRSRSIPIRKLSHDNLGLAVVLYNVDYTRITAGSVRVILRDDKRTSECLLKMFADDFTNRTFLGYFDYNWKSVSFVISGKCQGFSAYYINPTTVDPAFQVTPTRLWSL